MFFVPGTGYIIVYIIFIAVIGPYCFAGVVDIPTTHYVYVYRPPPTFSSGVVQFGSLDQSREWEKFRDNVTCGNWKEKREFCRERTETRPREEQNKKVGNLPKKGPMEKTNRRFTSIKVRRQKFDKEIDIGRKSLVC